MKIFYIFVYEISLNFCRLFISALYLHLVTLAILFIYLFFLNFTIKLILYLNRLPNHRYGFINIKDIWKKLFVHIWSLVCHNCYQRKKFIKTSLEYANNQKFDKVDGFHMENTDHKSYPSMLIFNFYWIWFNCIESSSQRPKRIPISNTE